MSSSLVTNALSAVKIGSSGHGRGLALALLLAVASVGSAGQQEARAVEPRFQITVRVYSYAGVTSKTLLRAEEEGTRIFRKTGVEVAWLDCAIPQSPEG